MDSFAKNVSYKKRYFVIFVTLPHLNLLKKMEQTGTLYLFPTPMSEGTASRVLPAYNNELLHNLRHFVVEELKTARRFIKASGMPTPIEELSFYELNEHTRQQPIDHMLAPLLGGLDVGLLSEAGCPAVADPGAELVKLAHARGIRVVPLVGPSSIVMALMSSGMNGQNFAFCGYLPVKEGRQKAIKSLESLSRQHNQTQIFIEAPYRNQKLLDDILATCLPETLLCIAVDITAPTESITTKPVKEWKRGVPDINKRPAIFLLHCC